MSTPTDLAGVMGLALLIGLGLAFAIVSMGVCIAWPIAGGIGIAVGLAISGLAGYRLWQTS